MYSYSNKIIKSYLPLIFSLLLIINPIINNLKYTRLVEPPNKRENNNYTQDTSKYRYSRIDGLPKRFDTVPETSGTIFRSNQPTKNQLRIILDNYPIKTIIRMNTEEGTGVTIEDEKKISANCGIDFYWINAHLGYSKGRGYLKSIDSVQKILKKGNVLIHCAAGSDRTGYQIAKYLQDNKGWNKKELWKYTTSYNSWKKYICEGRRGYIKYMEAFYGYDEWKSVHFSSCRNKSY